jgi:outer membrane protein assembly factor BamB
MATETPSSSPAVPSEPDLAQPHRPPRFWPAVVILTLFWIAFFVVGALDKPYFYGFLYSMGAAGLLVLVFSIWWWTNRRIKFSDRVFGFILVVGLGVLVAPFCHRSIWFSLPTLGLPIVLTTWIAWLVLAKGFGISRTRLGALAVVALTWGSFTLIRMDGVNADLQANLNWRWKPTAEEQFLAERARGDGARGLHNSLGAASALTLSPGDWAEFRGSGRDGVIPGVAISTDWQASPPRLLWRHRVGPSWSSVIVIGDHLFTQEQRGEVETVVCYQASTGQEVWVHEDQTRFWEGVSGAGPRATPTFSNGRIYTMGGTGILNCLDAASGERYWSHDIAADAGAKTPLWGFSASPLVVDGIVVAYAGGEGDNGLLAYKAESGDRAWAVSAGQGSYSSPQLTTIAGTKQCLMLSEDGLTSVDPLTGTTLWKSGLAMPGAPRVVQPHLVSDTRLVVGTLYGPGTALIDVTREADGWKATQVWATTQLKPEFPDFVVHQGHVYGFDIGVFCCIDLATGKRCWKEGRYGRGQVMLLADQGALLVISETGEAILLAANPERHEELARFRALEGKTWNHPVIAHGRMYVRNAEEMACYELPLK